MDYEAALIAKVLMEGCMDEVIDANVSSDLFPSHRKLWEWLHGSYRDHGGLPPLEAVEERYPNVDFEDTDTTVSFILDELRKKRASFLLTESMKEQAKLLKAKDPFAAMEEMRKVLMQADQDTRSSKDLNFAADTQQRLEAYFDRVSCDGVTGLPTPWDPLNEATQGFHDEDLIMIAGRSGTGKTFAEVILSLFHWSMGIKPLTISREMGSWQILQRMDGVFAKLPYGRFKSGQLTTMELERWKKSLKSIEGGLDFFVSSDDVGSVGVTGIRSKIRRYKPKILYIDGAYLIEDERGGKAEWSRFANVCWDLKKLARAEGLPIVVTHQFSKEGKGDTGDADTLKFGDVKMWFDTMIGMYQTEDLRLDKEMLFKVIKAREGENTQWVASWDLDKMDFSVKSSGKDDIPVADGTETVITSDGVETIDY